MKAVLLAGGKGTRLAPYTTVFPKPMMPIGDQPILEILIRQLKRHGFTEIILAVGYLSELMISYFGDGSKYGIKIKYSKEDKPLGTAGPLALIDGLKETFLVMNGDILTSLDFGKFLAQHKAKKCPVTVAVHDREVKLDYGIVQHNGQAIEKYLEKPTYHYSVSMGIYLFEPAALKHIRSGQPLDLPDLVKNLISAGETVGVYESADYWLDIGRHDDYEKAQTGYQEIKKLIFND
jgi:NDP-sugar pyrophosphorylase family protein